MLFSEARDSCPSPVTTPAASIHIVIRSDDTASTRMKLPSKVIGTPPTINEDDRLKGEMN